MAGRPKGQKAKVTRQKVKFDPLGFDKVMNDFMARPKEEKKLDEKKLALKAHKEANGNQNIDVQTASFQSLEVLANTLTQLENSIANFKYSIGIKKARIQASKDFYLQIMGKPYLKYTSKNGPVRQLKFTEANEWNKKNAHKVEPVIEPDPNHVPLPESI